MTTRGNDVVSARRITGAPAAAAAAAAAYASIHSQWQRQASTGQQQARQLAQQLIA